MIISEQQSKEPEEKFKCRACGKEYVKWGERAGEFGKGERYVHLCTEEQRSSSCFSNGSDITVSFNKYACSEECFDKIFPDILYKIREHYMKECLENCNIPPKYLDIVTDKKDLLNKCFKADNSVFLHGDVGTGKTVFACSLAREIILNSLSRVEFVSSPFLIMQIQDSFRDKSEETSLGLLKKYSKQEILLIDDLGSEKMTDFVRQSLYFIINHREQHLLKTIITSNHNLKQLSEYIDPRISSRIAGMCDVFCFSGNDRRLSK